MNASSLKKTRREYERVLASIFGLLIQCGMHRKAVSALATRALKTAMTAASPLERSGGGELVILSLVLDAWHRDRRYLTSRGRPRALPLLGRAPSIEALVRSEGPMFDAVELVYRIQSLRLITPCSGNRYRPIGDTALVTIYGPTVLQHLARSLMSLLETIEWNLSGVSTSAPLLERSAEVPDLPAEYADSFQQFSRFQGSIFARTINDWLETRRMRGGASGDNKKVRAGVHVHAYVAAAGTRRRVTTRSKM